MAGRGGGIIGLLPQESCVDILEDLFYALSICILLHHWRGIIKDPMGLENVAGGIDCLPLSLLMVMINGFGSSNYYIQL